MQLLLPFCTSLLLDILAHDCCIAVTAYRTNIRAFGPKFATPKSLFDRRHVVKDRSGRQTFAHLDHFGWTSARDGLHKKMDLIVVCANLYKSDRITLGYVQADVFAHRVDLRVKDDTSRSEERRVGKECRL